MSVSGPLDEDGYAQRFRQAFDGRQAQTLSGIVGAFAAISNVPFVNDGEATKSDTAAIWFDPAGKGSSGHAPSLTLSRVTAIETNGGDFEGKIAAYCRISLTGNPPTAAFDAASPAGAAIAVWEELIDDMAGTWTARSPTALASAALEFLDAADGDLGIAEVTVEVLQT